MREPIAICAMCDKRLFEYDGALLHAGGDYWCAGSSASVATPAALGLTAGQEGDNDEG